MRNNYQAITSSADDGDDIRISNGGSDRTRPPLMTWIQGAIAAVLILVAYFTGFYWGGRKTRDTIHPGYVTENVQVPEKDTILTRPFCQSHDGTMKIPPRLLQTSMKQPHLQWAEISCVETTTPNFFQPKPTAMDYLNMYGLPDAILQVNFSQLAHPDRRIPIMGFGGAFTEAAGRNFNRLTKEGQDAVMELLFGATGLGYAIGRFHINSCDFSVDSYTFDDTVDDFELNDFDIGVHHDVETGMVGMALRAVSVLRQSWSGKGPEDGEMFLYASPWSPPAWMKKPTWEDLKRNPNATTAHKMTYSDGPNCLKEGVGPDSRYAKAWALYFSKFLTAYENLGLPLQAVTVQNEPEFPAPWEACSYTPETELDFVANHLGPQLRKDHPDVQLIVFDHNKDHMITWLDTLFNESSKAKPYIAGTAYHWYAGGMDRLLDGALGTPNMHRLQDKLQEYGVKPDHLVLGSESCHCPSTGYAGGDISVYWARAERYAHTILADLAAGSNGWVEWNLILDGIGGPNHLGNLCESMILAVPHRAKRATPDIPPLPDFEYHHPMGNRSICDERTREELNSLGFPAKYLDVGVAVQPIYYYMGHISRYVRPGSVAVMGLVQESLGVGRIFRPEGSVVAGGGQNDLARVGIELTVWPCEGSTRQQFKWDVDNTKHIIVYGHDWLGNPTTSCIGRSISKDFKGLLLTTCDESIDDEANKPGRFDVLPIVGEEGLHQIKILNHRMRKEYCLVIRELGNGGGAYGPRGGSQITLGSCDKESSQWFLDKTFGEISSLYFSLDPTGTDERVCMTTGWPFLQMGAFLTPNGDSAKTIVILNESNDPANFAIRDDVSILVTASIPGRSIQTLLLE